MNSINYLIFHKETMGFVGLNTYRIDRVSNNQKTLFQLVKELAQQVINFLEKISYINID